MAHGVDVPQWTHGTCYVKHPGDCPRAQHVWAKFCDQFAGTMPTLPLNVVVVSGLPRDAMVEFHFAASSKPVKVRGCRLQNEDGWQSWFALAHDRLYYTVVARKMESCLPPLVWPLHATYDLTPRSRGVGMATMLSQPRGYHGPRPKHSGCQHGFSASRSFKVAPLGTHTLLAGSRQLHCLQAPRGCIYLPSGLARSSSDRWHTSGCAECSPSCRWWPFSRLLHPDMPTFLRAGRDGRLTVSKTPQYKS